MTTTTLAISGVAAPVRTLGPGPAAGVWVQGCSLACSGCMSADTWNRRFGQIVNVGDLAAWLESTDLEFLTISGGEPTEQAPALCELIDCLDNERWKITCYSGHEFEGLLNRRDADIAALIERLDLLIDGPYVAKLHAPLRWRGSANQRLRFLSDRISTVDDSPAGIELHAEPDGSMRFIGVPPQVGFTRSFEQAHGVAPLAGSMKSTLPFPTETSQTDRTVNKKDS